MNNNLEFIEVKPRLSFVLLFLITADLVLLAVGYFYLAIAVVLLAISLLYKTTGVIVDKDKNRVKKVNGFWGLKMGTWKMLPKINYVSLLRVKQCKKSFQASSAMFVQESSNSNVYKVNLVVAEGHKQRVFNLINASRDVAIEKGLAVGEYLDLKVLDVTTHNKQWIR